MGYVGAGGLEPTNQRGSELWLVPKKPGKSGVERSLGRNLSVSADIGGRSPASAPRGKVFELCGGYCRSSYSAPIADQKGL